MITQEDMRYYLFAIAGFALNADIINACKANQPEGNTLSLTFLKRAGGGLPTEILVKVNNATNEWEGNQDWIETALNIFQFDPPQARGDFEDRNVYVEDNKMPIAEDENGWPVGGLPTWYTTISNTYPLLQDFMPL